MMSVTDFFQAHANSIREKHGLAYCKVHGAGERTGDRYRITLVVQEHGQGSRSYTTPLFTPPFTSNDDSPLIQCLNTQIALVYALFVNDQDRAAALSVISHVKYGSG